MEDPGELAALVSLLREEPHDPVALARRVRRNGRAEDLLTNDRGLFAAAALAQAASDLAAWHEIGIEALPWTSPDYPALLADLPEAPVLLFVAGRLLSADARSVAVVGSRRASADGLALTRRIVHALVESGQSVVSGLADGVDTAAHRAALDAGGRTLAVIGSGLCHAYPAANRQLQAEIARRGAVVSQFWPEARPDRRTFPVRNALMASLTTSTVIVEASERSGTRIQARAAIRSGRGVVLMAGLMDQPWARELAAHPEVVIADGPEAVVQLVAPVEPTPNAVHA